MFFLVSKLAWAVAVPSTFLLLVVLVGLAIAAGTRLRRTGLGLATLAVAALLVIGTLPVWALATRPLEDRFPLVRDEGEVAGIIALGGGIYTDVTASRGQLELGEANERLIYLADLARRHPDAVLVFAGGGGTLVPENTSEAGAVARYARVLGLPVERIRFDDASRNTWENAVNALKLIDPKPGERWLLVTSARHMPRAVGCFRRAGLDVTAFPVDYLTRDGGETWTDLSSAAAGLSRFDDAMKEWVGLLAYRWSGRTSALYPSPSDGPSR